MVNDETWAALEPPGSRFRPFQCLVKDLPELTWVCGDDGVRMHVNVPTSGHVPCGPLLLLPPDMVSRKFCLQRV